jgi:hypothetical protein
MVVFELPATREGGALRAVSLGSCRVRNPLFVLRERGALRILAEGPTPTHTAEEAAQSLSVFTGQMVIPEALCKFVFEYDHRPAMAGLARALSQPTDVFILEISDDKQFSYRGILLNQNFVSRHFVQPHRGALLEWYREISRGRPAEEATVETALGKLHDGGFAHDETMADLLRGITLARRDGAAIAATLETLGRTMGGRWVIVGLFAVPGDDSEVMRRRRLFNEALAKAAVQCGATFYDPSQLIVEHGKDAVLAGGVSIYEYDEAFYPTLGKALVGQIRAVGPPPAPAVAPTGAALPAPIALPEMARSSWAIWLEAKAIALSRRPRRWIRKVRRAFGSGGSRPAGP